MASSAMLLVELLLEELDGVAQALVDGDAGS